MGRQKQPKLSLILPCYNVANILENLLDVIKEVSDITEDYEIVLIDDGNETFPYIVQNDYIKVITHNKNKGKGASIISGLSVANGEIIAFLDADLQISPKHLKPYYDIITGGRSPDVLIGSKRHAGSEVDYPFFRRVMSFGFQNINRILFGLTVLDTQVGIKFFKKDVIKEILPLLETKGFAIDLEILSLAQIRKHRILEAPVRIDESFKSTINVMAVFRMLFDAIKIWGRRKILK